MATRTARKNGQAARARAGKKKKSVNHNHTHPKPRKKHYILPITKSRFKKALAGTGGLQNVIAERLGCSRVAVKNRLDDPKWEDVRQEWEDEKERIKDVAEDTIQYIIEQRLDLPAALRASQWYLERQAKERGYASEQKVKVEGGDNPIRHELVAIPATALDLPLELRVKLLEAVEQKEQEVIDVGSVDAVEREGNGDS